MTEATGDPSLKPASDPSAGVLRAAGAVGLATLCSRVLGLVREQVFAVMFGAGNLTDAFNVAFRIPNLLRNLFAEGAMSASLVPTFTRARELKGERSAWRVAGLVFRVLFAVVGILSLLGMLFAPELVGLYASAFRQVPGKFELTVRMTRVMFPFFPLVALAAAYMGILNACGVFFLPAFSSALFNLGSIVVGVAAVKLLVDWGPEWGLLPIEGMALGVLAGGLLQAFCQLPALYRQGYRWKPRHAPDPAWHEDPHLRAMLGMMVPGTVGLAATQVSLLVSTWLATSQGPGAVSWLNYAFRLMQFPIGVFGVSLASAALPLVSRQWVQRDIRGVERTLSQGLRHLFAINLPASAGLAFLGVPIVALIFQYGRFTSEDTQATALALVMYSIGLTAYSAVKLLVPACYALGNTRVPVVASVLSVAVAVVLSLILVGPLGFWSLALATSVAAIVNCLILLQAIRRLLLDAGGAFPLRPLAKAFLVQLCVASIMGAMAFLTYRFAVDRWLPDHLMHEIFGKTGVILGRVLKIALVIGECAALIVLLSRVLGITDTVEAVDIFTKKLKKKLSRPKT